MTRRRTQPGANEDVFNQTGFGSKAIVTGDITQIDLPRAKSGLIDAYNTLEGVTGIEFCFLTDADVVRHPLVKRIINAYEQRKLSDEDEDEGTQDREHEHEE